MLQLTDSIQAEDRTFSLSLKRRDVCPLALIAPSFCSIGLHLVIGHKLTFFRHFSELGLPGKPILVSSFPDEESTNGSLGSGPLLEGTLSASFALSSSGKLKVSDAFFP